MLLNNFFSIASQEQAPGLTTAVIHFHGQHPIFKGHFPGLPVVPGVTMMQMVREILELQLGRKFFISGVDTMKFLAVINPEKNKSVEVRVTFVEEENALMVNATLFDGNVTFFKLIKATFQYT